MRTGDVNSSPHRSCPEEFQYLPKLGQQRGLSFKAKAGCLRILGPSEIVEIDHA